MSSISQEEEFHPIIKEAFSNEKLTGYDIACSSEMTDLIRRDSSEFAMGLIKHKRGREIVCELVDVALRPRVLISYLQRKQQEQLQSNPLSEKGLKSSITESSKEITTIVFNAIEILTNQYEEFVQFIFGENNKSEFLKEGKISSEGIKEEYDFKRIAGSFEKNIDNDDDFEDEVGDGDKIVQEGWGSGEEEEHWEEGVIMDSGYPELTRNEEDELLQKIISTTKIQPNETYKSSFLDRMFLLFQEQIPIEETPVSYFNKIMLQFVYQKPEEIMRYFYCDEKGKGAKAKSNIDINKSENNKIKKLTKKNTNTISSNSLTSSGNLKTPRIRLIARHLYNNSVIELIGHLMELESDGNFFSPEKIDILKAITEEVFPTVKVDFKKYEVSSSLIMETSTMIDLTEDRISNFVLFMRQMYEKLEDRYEQEKFLSVFKYYINDLNVIKRVGDYFRLQESGFNAANGLVPLLTQILKFDKLNFIKHKSQLPSVSSFGGGDHFGSHSTSLKEDSSIASYDIKLSSEVLNEIEKIILILIQKNTEQESSTIKMIEFYDLLYNWFNIIVTSRQQMVTEHIITTGFINDCLFKFEEYERANILHNSIKNILVDFLPKFNHALNIILDPQCHLVDFLENYLLVDKNEISQKGKKGKRKVKCFENQLFHIGKAVMSIWEQQKMPNINKKTKKDEEDSLEKIQSSTFDREILIQFEKLKEIIEKKEEFYNHLICGDPRKMGEYQEDESSEIIIASSSLKNYFKPKSENNTENDDNNNEILNSKKSEKSSKDRYSDIIDDEDEEEEVSKKDKPKKKLDIQDLKRDTNLKTDPKFISLRIGVDHSSSLFESAISPLNAYRSHSFNFETDALPLDSDNDNSEQMSEEEDFPLRNEPDNNDEAKLMQENIENLDMMGTNFVLGMDSNILSNNSISNERSNIVLNGDNYHREELSKSMDIPDLGMDTIEKIESYNAIESPRLQSTDEILSLGMDSKYSGEKMSDEQIESRLEVVTSEIVSSFIKDEQKSNLEHERMELEEDHKSEPLRPYSSYLKYNIDDLCMDLE